MARSHPHAGQKSPPGPCSTERASWPLIRRRLYQSGLGALPRLPLTTAYGGAGPLSVDIRATTRESPRGETLVP
jgi:hypothetical protein